MLNVDVFAYIDLKSFTDAGVGRKDDGSGAAVRSIEGLDQRILTDFTIRSTIAHRPSCTVLLVAKICKAWPAPKAPIQAPINRPNCRSL